MNRIECEWFVQCSFHINPLSLVLVIHLSEDYSWSEKKNVYHKVDKKVYTHFPSTSITCSSFLYVLHPLLRLGFLPFQGFIQPVIITMMISTDMIHSFFSSSSLSLTYRWRNIPPDMTVNLLYHTIISFSFSKKLLSTNWSGRRSSSARRRI